MPAIAARNANMRKATDGPIVPGDLTRDSCWKRKARSLLRRGVVHAAAPLSRLWGTVVPGSFGILMYHRVCPETPGVPTPTWNVTPARFRRQLCGLLKRGFRPVALRRVLQAHRDGRPVPERSFVVTFDDGYANNYEFAWPILSELKVPATIFLATAYLDSQRPFPFDDWSAAGSDAVLPESWRPLSTRECLEMRDGGLIELGAHTHSHRDFRGKPDELRADLRRCVATMRSQFDVERPTFAFPYGTKSLGFCGPVFARVVQEEDLVCSLTTEREVVRPGTSPFHWGRFTAERADTAATLAVKLSGWFETLRNGLCRTPR